MPGRIWLHCCRRKMKYKLEFRSPEKWGKAALNVEPPKRHVQTTGHYVKDVGSYLAGTPV